MFLHMAGSLVVVLAIATLDSVIAAETDRDSYRQQVCEPSLSEDGTDAERHACAAAGQRLLQHGLNVQSQGRVETDTEAWGQRALLSKRDSTSRSGCAFCWCHAINAAKCGTSAVTDAAECGSSYVTSAAKCGERTVTSIADCGSSAVKACSYGRRRRFTGLKCKFKDVAKSCTVPNSCDVPNTCDIAAECDFTESFGDCLTEIASSLDDDLHGYIGYIRDCNSFSDCKSKVLEGLDTVWDLAEVEAVEAVPDLITDALGALDSATILNHAVDAGEAFIDMVKPIFATIASTLSQYLGGGVPGFEKADLGAVCTPEGSGFWGMEATDCGAFDKMSQVFDNLAGAQGKFEKAVTKFGTCAAKQGLFGFPTPFFDLQIERYCMPSTLVTAVEYMLGAVSFAANAGQTIAEAITGLVDKVKDFAENHLNLFEVAKTVHAMRHRRLGKNVSLAQLKSDCGPQANWGVDAMITTGVSIPVSSTASFNLGFSMGIGLGCVDDRMVLPNWLMYLKFDSGSNSSEPAEGVSSDVGIEFTFHDTYPTYDIAGRVAGTGVLEVVPAGETSVKGTGVGTGVPVNFRIDPDDSSSLPKSFTFGIVPSSGGGNLAQLGEDSPATAQFAKASSKMKAGIQRASPAFSKESILKKAAALDEHRGHLLAEAHRRTIQKSKKSKRSKATIKPDLAVNAGVNFAFCLTPGSCNTR